MMFDQVVGTADSKIHVWNTQGNRVPMMIMMVLVMVMVMMVLWYRWSQAAFRS